MTKLLLWLLLLSSVLFTGLLRPTPADAQGERLVLAFYYAWFDLTTWQKPLSDQPTQPYASTDPAAIERHVREAQQAGINAFVQSWYGPQVENNQTETNFRQLLDISTRQGFGAAVDLEVTSPFLYSTADVVNALNYLLAVHAQHPAYLRVTGKPVIFFWRQGQYPVETWNMIRDQVDPDHASIWIMEGTDVSYLGPFDGLHLYSVAWSDDPAGTLMRWGERAREWSAAQGVSKTWVATVMPGYDDNTCTHGTIHADANRCAHAHRSSHADRHSSWWAPSAGDLDHEDVLGAGRGRSGAGADARRGLAGSPQVMGNLLKRKEAGAWVAGIKAR